MLVGGLKGCFEAPAPNWRMITQNHRKGKRAIKAAMQQDNVSLLQSSPLPCMLAIGNRICAVNTVPGQHTAILTG